MWVANFPSHWDQKIDISSIIVIFLLPDWCLGDFLLRLSKGLSRLWLVEAESVSFATMDRKRSWDGSTNEWEFCTSHGNSQWFMAGQKTILIIPSVGEVFISYAYTHLDFSIEVRCMVCHTVEKWLEAEVFQSILGHDTHSVGIYSQKLLAQKPWATFWSWCHAQNPDGIW